MHTTTIDVKIITTINSINEPQEDKTYHAYTISNTQSRHREAKEGKGASRSGGGAANGRREKSTRGEKEGEG